MRGPGGLALLRRMVPSVCEERRDRALLAERARRARLRARPRRRRRRCAPSECRRSSVARSDIARISALRCRARRKSPAPAPVRAAQGLAWGLRKARRRLRRGARRAVIVSIVPRYPSARLGLRDQRGERCGLGDRDIGEHLAVDRDPSLAEAVDKSAVGQAVLAHRGVDALDPERAEVALLVLAVAIGVLPALSTAALAVRMVFLRRP